MAAYRAHSLRAQLISLALLLSAAAPGNVGSLHDAKLFELTRFSRFDFGALKGKKFLLVFFQTECPPCREQLKALQCLKDQRPEAEIVAAGVGDAKELAKEVKRLGLTFPTLESTIAFQAKFRGVQATPLTFRIDEKGIPSQRETGVRDCESWISRFSVP
jgi:thiol-disulfide isomerase/thioredoxin